MSYFTISTHPHPLTLNRFKVGLVKILLFFLFFVYFTLDFVSFLLFPSSSSSFFLFSLKKWEKSATLDPRHGSLDPMASVSVLTGFDFILEKF